MKIPNTAIPKLRRHFTQYALIYVLVLFWFKGIGALLSITIALLNTYLIINKEKRLLRIVRRIKAEEKKKKTRRAPSKGVNHTTYKKKVTKKKVKKK